MDSESRILDYYESLECHPVVKAGNGFINSLALDSDSNDLLLCGAADSSISVYSLEQLRESVPAGPDMAPPPLAKIERKQGHEFGVSKVQWWPEDAGLFFTSSFDKTLKAWETESLENVYTFDMEHKIYNFDINGITAQTAVASDHPFIRLVDINSASTSHSLRGHSGAVLSVKWSPTDPNILASAGSDGSVRIWDTRQAQPMLMAMDLMHTVGHPIAPMDYRKAHRGAVNGLCWDRDGKHLCSLGNDNKARLWDLTQGDGINSGVNYGPMIRNSSLQTCDPIMSYDEASQTAFLLVPIDDGHILVYEAMTGSLFRKIRPQKFGNKRQACLELAGTSFDVISGDGDGFINLWSPQESEKESIKSGALASTPPARLGDYL